MRKDYYNAARCFLEAYIDKKTDADKAARRRWFSAAAAVFAIYAGALLLLSFSYQEERLIGEDIPFIAEFAADSQSVPNEAAAFAQESGSIGISRQTAAAKTIPAELYERKEPQKADDPHKQTQPQPEKTDVSARQSKSQKAEQRNSSAAARDSLKSSKKAAEAANGGSARGKTDGSGKTAAQSAAQSGLDGRREAVWADLVYRKIQTAGRRLQRQLPDRRGIAVVALRYDNDGVIINVHIARSSGNSLIDSLAERIVKASSPLPRPERAGEKLIPIRVN